MELTSDAGIDGTRFKALDAGVGCIRETKYVESYSGY